MPNPLTALKEKGGRSKALGKSAFDLSDGTAGERTLVASREAQVPIRVREGPAARLAFVAGEEKTTNATADDTETFSLSHNLVDSKNTENLILYAGGSRVQPDSIDYANDAFDYTDAGTETTLHAFYVARDPGVVTVEKVAPKTSSQMSETLTEDTTSGIADRDQNQNPVQFEFTDPYQGVVPANWSLNIYVDSPFAVRWDDANLSTSNGDDATNALIDIPIVQYEGTVSGLGRAVKRSALDLE
mgnify:FL=1